jgi:hypothetical protein
MQTQVEFFLFIQAHMSKRKLINMLVPRRLSEWATPEGIASVRSWLGFGWP